MRSKLTSTIIIIAVVLVGILILGGLLSLTIKPYYFLERIEQQEVGVRFRQGRIHEIVGPGLYTDIGLYVEIKRISSTAIAFSVQDDEIITKDKQRIGLVVNGDIFRPNLAEGDILRDLWAQYSNIYLSDEVARLRVEALARQAMKVCIGERTFDDNVIGSARDVLRECIDTEVSQLALNYGLQVGNVIVPNIILSPEAQSVLDAITKSRLDTEKAAQDKLKAEAEALAEQARQRGEVAVAQSRIQEETKQQTLLAQLDQEKLIAQKAVIEAQKANDLLAAQQDLEINQALAKAAAEKAKADLALEIAKAEMLAKNPGYLQFQMAQTNANALKATDKIIFTPEGTMPTIVLSGPGIVPTVDTTP
ncbi:MAG: SPFH domain-containing protein [Anaerolineae bacterium]|nr:SPFH domain-containing protein [Anaerolineae bacterium]